MDLQEKNIMFACGFAAEYGGNFIMMLRSLADFLQQKYHAQVYFLFPIQEKKSWLEELEKSYNIGFTHLPYAKSTDEILYFIRKWNVDLIHTHFEAYDVPVSKAVRKSHRQIKMIWHLHDYLTLDKVGLSFPFIRKVGTSIKFWLHYGLYGKNAYFIGVSSEITKFVCHYRRHLFAFPKICSKNDLKQENFERAKVVINGIDLARIKDKKQQADGTFVFLTFGGFTKTKGIPCILDAADKLYNQEKRHFRLMITKGVGTADYVVNRYGGNIPEYIELVNQTSNITSLFEKSKCFISASLQETMSMAIAEASIYGLPVIQSDILGTWWNADNPSTFLFRVNDTNDLLKQMKCVMDYDEHLLDDMCKQTIEVNKQRLSMNGWVNNIISVYEKV